MMTDYASCQLINYSDDLIVKAADKFHDEDPTRYSCMCWQFKYVLDLFAQKCDGKYDAFLMDNTGSIGLMKGFRFDDFGIGNKIVIELIKLIRDHPRTWMEFVQFTEDVYYAKLLEIVEMGELYKTAERLNQHPPELNGNNNNNNNDYDTEEDDEGNVEQV